MHCSREQTCDRSFLPVLSQTPCGDLTLLNANQKAHRRLTSSTYFFSHSLKTQAARHPRQPRPLSSHHPAGRAARGHPPQMLWQRPHRCVQGVPQQTRACAGEQVSAGLVRSHLFWPVLLVPLAINTCVCYVCVSRAHYPRFIFLCSLFCDRSYTSRDDLIEALMTSCHIPW